MHLSFLQQCLFWAVLAAAAGCRRSEQPSSPPAPQPSSRPDDLNFNGIRYDLPLTGSDMERATELLKAVRPNGVSWSGKGHTLEVADGRIKVDGKDRGTVKSGDRVKLTADGFLSVNGEKRETQDVPALRKKDKAVDDSLAKEKPEEPKKQPPAKAEVKENWSLNSASYLPGYLAPLKGTATAEPKKALQKICREFANDPASKKLLKKLLRVQTLEVEVLEADPPKGFRPARLPRSPDDGLLMIYFPSVPQAEQTTFLEVPYCVVSARSESLTSLFADANDWEAVRLAVNDFLLRNKVGHAFDREAEFPQMKSAEEWRGIVDAGIERHVKRNAALPLHR